MKDRHISPFLRNYGSIPTSSTVSPLLFDEESGENNSSRYDRYRNPSQKSAPLVKRKPPLSFETDLAPSTYPTASRGSKSLLMQTEEAEMIGNPFDETTTASSVSTVARDAFQSLHSKHAVVTLLESFNTLQLTFIIFAPVVLLAIVSSCLEWTEANNHKFITTSCGIINRIEIIQSGVLSSKCQQSSIEYTTLQLTAPLAIGYDGYDRVMLRVGVLRTYICNLTFNQPSASVSTSTERTNEPVLLGSYASIAQPNACDSFHRGNTSTSNTNELFIIQVPLYFIDRSTTSLTDERQKQLALNVSLFSPLSDSEQQLPLAHASIVLDTQRYSPSYLSTSSAIILSLLTFLFLIYFSSSTVTHAMQLSAAFKLSNDQSVLPKSNLGQVRGTLDIILPEQYTALSLLFFLLMWQNPVGSYLAMAKLVSEAGSETSKVSLTVAGCLQTCSSFG